MKRHRAGKEAVALAGLALALFLGSSFVQAGEPRIKFKELVWDFGMVKQGEILSHEFVFSNEGDSTLVIRKVATSCGCAAALVSDEKLAPGKQGKIEVRFDTRGYGDRVSKYIFVDSNDPGQARVQLEVTADIEVPPAPKIDIDPYNHDAGLVVAGEELRASLKIMNKGELELRVEFNHRNAAFFLGGKPAPSPLKIAARKEVNLEVRIPTQDRTGTVREYVLIKSNDPMRSTLSLYLSGYIITKGQLKELFNKYKDILH
jgi:hypothetical protein